MPWTNDAELFIVAGLILMLITLMIGDRVKLPGGFEILARKQVRIVLGVLGLSLFVWGCVLGIG